MASYTTLEPPTGLKRWILSVSDYPPFITCKCNWCYERYEEHCVDPWSILHFIIGGLIGLLYFYIGNYAILLTFILSVVWEFFENTEMGIKFTSIILCSNGYSGDNMWNSIFDVLIGTFGSVITSVLVLSFDEKNLIK